MKPTAPGYMILLTIMISAAAVAAVTYIARKRSVYMPRIFTACEKEKAMMLAQSGIQVVLSQLAGGDPRTDADKNKQPKDPYAADKQMLSFLLPALGRWQTYVLHEKADGINGKIKICITSEDGKLDLNTAYDFKEKKFVGEKENNEEKNYRTVVEKILNAVGALTGAQNLFKGLEEFLKKQDAPLSDITQLLTIKEFEPFKSAVFYEPSDNKKNIALADLFTVWGAAGLTINAWLLSPSIQRSIGNMQSDFMVKMDDALVKKVVESYDPNLKLPQAWPTVFQPIYEIPLASLPTYVKGVLDIKFGPRVFSVLSYGIVGKTTQKLLAIITIKKDPSSGSDAAYSVVIKKLYWL